MLQLSLEQGDYLVIGDNVKVRFSHLNDRNRNMAVIGIDAPREISVVRGAVYEQTLKEQAAEGDQKAKEEIKKINLERERYEQKRKDAVKQHNQRRLEKLTEKHRDRATMAAAQ
jgi:sRNA-binding carbon storage regulator CsrA